MSPKSPKQQVPTDDSWWAESRHLETHLKYMDKPKLEKPIAIVGAPGLRSVGRMAVAFMVRVLDAKLFAELYSPRFCSIFSGPSYLGFPGLPGGIEYEGAIDLPKVRFYHHKNLILTMGIQADVQGQYEVASKTVEFYEELGVKKIIALAGHGSGGKKVFCAATDAEMLKELEKYNLQKRESGEFYGFSALVLGIGKLRKMDGFCIFGETSLSAEMEYPDVAATKIVLDRLCLILGLDLSTSALEPVIERDLNYG